jgi:type III secretion protein N (ATPase)
MIGVGQGTVTALGGGLIHACIPGLRVGDGASVGLRRARVVAVDGGSATLAPLGTLDGIAAGDPIRADPLALTQILGTPLLGRSIDAAGLALDDGAPPRGLRLRIEGAAVAPGQRRPLREICWTGIRAIDGPLAFARGARIGIFGTAGCGKSTLIERIVAGADADAVVIALVGERGREAERWIASANARTTVVCATGDRSAAERAQAADVAIAQAVHLAQRGLEVLLVIDSLARVAAANREVALAAGELPGRGGYPPSVFAHLARLVERAGAFRTGTVTLVASVLSEGSDDHDPVAEAARAALDGHLTLSPALAARGHFPALDLARSTSRTLADVAAGEHRAAAASLCAAVAWLEETREARSFGLTSPGLRSQAYLRAEPAISAFLTQGEAPSAPRRTLRELIQIAETIK